MEFHLRSKKMCCKQLEAIIFWMMASIDAWCPGYIIRWLLTRGAG